MSYVDGFVAAVPTANKEAYRDFAARAAVMLKEFGAIGVMEAWGDDVPEGVLTSFPMAVKRADDETVVFAWIIWPSKEARAEGHARMMTDSRMNEEEMRSIFDGKRMIFGGFVPIVEA